MKNLIIKQVSEVSHWIWLVSCMLIQLVVYVQMVMETHLLPYLFLSRDHLVDWVLLYCCPDCFFLCSVLFHDLSLLGSVLCLCSVLFLCSVLCSVLSLYYVLSLYSLLFYCFVCHPVAGWVCLMLKKRTAK